MKTLKNIAVGVVGGAVIMALLVVVFSAMLHLFLGANNSYSASHLSFLSRDAILGSLLGAFVYPGFVAMREGNGRKASQLCFSGGFLMAALMITQISYVFYLASSSIVSGAKVYVLGPDQIPLRLRIIIASFMFNLPLQLSLVLIAVSRWQWKKAAQQPPKNEIL